MAAGAVARSLGVAWGCLLAAAGVLSRGSPLPPGFLLVLGAYVVNNVLYNAVVKRVGIADVISIAIGFVLRLVAGSIAIGVVAVVVAAGLRFLAGALPRLRQAPERAGAGRVRPRLPAGAEGLHADDARLG